MNDPLPNRAAYPVGSVRALLASSLVTGSTREAMAPRVDPVPDPATPRFFDPAAFATLAAVCARLLPPDSALSGQAAAGGIDQRQAEGKGNGWRYDGLPPDGEALRRGLHGLDESSELTGVETFVQLNPSQQDRVLGAVQWGDAAGATWRRLDGRRWFEELLADVTELHASHPLTQERIGYAGFADAAGWRRIGLNEREAWEPAAGAASVALPATLPTPSPRREASPGPMKMRLYPPTEVVDAVVIGTGAGGGPLLARLAQAGLRIVALEAGKWWDPARDFATDEKAQTKLFWTDERLSAGGDPLAFGNNNSGIGVGGSTLHYTVYTPRPQPDDFHLHRDFGVGVDWPFGYGELEPYFDELETLLGVSGSSPYPWGPPRRRSYHQHLASFYADTRESPAEALRWARRELESCQSVFAHESLGWALYRTGDFEAAAVAFDQAVALKTPSAHLLFQAGTVYFRAGQVARGREFIQRARAVNPRFEAFHVHR